MTRLSLCKYSLPAAELPVTIKIKKDPSILGAAPSTQMSILPPGATAWTRKAIVDKSTATEHIYELPRPTGLVTGTALLFQVGVQATLGSTITATINNAAGASSSDALAANDPLEIFVYRLAIA